MIPPVRFVRRVLLIHLLVLCGMIALVVVAAQGVYTQARHQALNQAAERQRLLAKQTAQGIQRYYESILSNLELIRRSDPENERRPEPPPQVELRRPEPDRRDSGRRPLTQLRDRPAPFMIDLLWNQLDDRISCLFVTNASKAVSACFPAEKHSEAEGIVARSIPWLKTIEKQTVGPFQQIGEGWGHLICEPLPVRPGGPRSLLVAVVPIEGVHGRLLNNLTNAHGSVATLLDDTGQTMIGQVGDPQLSQMAEELRQSGSGGARIVDAPTPVGEGVVAPRIIGAEPIHVGGKNWLVLVSSPIAEINEMVAGIFGKALFWAAFVVVVMTATLVATSTAMIRTRARVERVKHELMAHELEQARRIQLSWLPDGKAQTRSLDIAAVNHPASQISGDFYDWFELPDRRTVVTIGDVTGHGMAAAFLMATTQLLIRTTMQRLGDPGKCLEEVNRQLCAQVFNGQFVTALIVVLDPLRGTMQAASAGHFAPLLVGPEDARPMELITQLVLGVQQDEVYPTDTARLAERFALVLYTDGVVDARSQSGKRFAISGLCAAVAGQGGSAEGLVDGIAKRVREFVGNEELEDDVTVVAVRGQTVRVGEPAGVVQTV